MQRSMGAGAGEKARDIYLHVLTKKLGDHLSSSIILKMHVFIGYDATSKIGARSSAMKNNPEKFIEVFGIW